VHEVLEGLGSVCTYAKLSSEVHELDYNVGCYMN